MFSEKIPSANFSVQSFHCKNVSKKFSEKNVEKFLNHIRSQREIPEEKYAEISSQCKVPTANFLV